MRAGRPFHVVKYAQRILAGLFFLGLALTALTAFYERDARTRWREARDLQGTSQYDAERSDHLYEAVDAWHARRTQAYQALLGVGLILSGVTYFERRAHQKRR